MQIGIILRQTKAGRNEYYYKKGVGTVCGGIGRLLALGEGLERALALAGRELALGLALELGGQFEGSPAQLQKRCGVLGLD